MKKSIKSFVFFLFLILTPFSFAYADCSSMSNFKYKVSFLYEKSGYKVFSLNGSLVYTINSQVIHPKEPSCQTVSDGDWYFSDSFIATIVGSTIYHPSKEESVPASVFYYSRYYHYNCSVDKFLNLKTKECKTCPKDYFLNQDTGKCEKELQRPDWCPEPMLYEGRKVDRFLGSDTIEECTPNPSINEDECNKRNMYYHSCFDIFDNYQALACMSIPQGCYAQQTAKKLRAEADLADHLFTIGGFMLPIPIHSLKNGLSSLGSYLRNLFSSGTKPPVNLLEYRPQLVDMKATKLGPEPVFKFNPVNDEAIITNNTFRETGKLDSTLPTSSNILKTPQKLADVSPNLKKFDIPKDASISGLENNAIVAAKLKDMAEPMPTKEVTLPNELKNVNLDYDLSTMFKNLDKPTPNLPMTIQQTSKVGNKTTYKGNIATPDNSLIDVEVIETLSSTGSKIQDVTFSYNYKTSGGNKKATTGYINVIDVGNKVTNSIPKDGVTTNPTTGSTSPNSGLTTAPNQSLDLSSLERAINQNSSKLDTINNTLTQTKTQLERANDTLTSIKNQQQAQWNYNPNINTATSFSSFQAELTKLDVSIKDAFNFLNNLKSDIENLMNDFSNSLDIFANGIDTPDIPRGTCPFKISGPTPGSNKTNSYEIDPCRFVSPYKPILTIFFTIWFSFEIIMFSLKYLFRVGGDS